MIHVDGASRGRCCDSLSRRTFVQLGMAGMGALTLPNLLQARESAASGKDTRCILIWLDGGPSHMDLWDMKPDAPAEYRGMWQPIRTNVPGTQITEMFPKQAKVADKFSIVRSLHHDTGDHFGAAHKMLTGRGGANGSSRAGRYPGIGAIATTVAGSRRPPLPAYVSVPYASSVGVRPGYFGGNYLGSQADPFETDGDPNRADFKVRHLSLTSGLSLDRLDDRRHLRQKMDAMRRSAEKNGMVDAMNTFEQRAYDLVSSDIVRRAFDIGAEDAKLRERYGRHSWGQSVLLARRLAEAGVTFTTVHMGGWDHHWNLKEGMERYLPRLDNALSALFADLDARGLMEKVMVLVCGEFSRTPRMNDGSGRGTPGRDHWGNSMSCIVAGGGLKNGIVVGATDPHGERPMVNPVTPGDLHSTIYHVLGVDPHTSFTDFAGRPVPAVDHGQPIRDLL